MSRAHRLPGGGGLFHLTHRCHNRAFLLKFARDRNAYWAKLREHLLQHQLWLLDYCLTCNHVHLLVDAPERSQMSAWMQSVAGEFPRAYNRRKVQKNLEASVSCPDNTWAKRWRESKPGGNPAGQKAWLWGAHHLSGECSR